MSDLLLEEHAAPALVPCTKEEWEHNLQHVMRFSGRSR